MGGKRGNRRLWRRWRYHQGIPQAAEIESVFELVIDPETLYRNLGGSIHVSGPLFEFLGHGFDINLTIGSHRAREKEGANIVFNCHLHQLE